MGSGGALAHNLLRPTALNASSSSSSSSSSSHKGPWALGDRAREHLQTPWMQNSESMVTTTYEITPSSNSLLGVGGGGFVEDLWRTSSSSNTWGQIWIHLSILTMKSVRIFTLRCLEEAMWAMEPWFVISFTVVKSWFFVSFWVFKSWFCWNK